jgi:tetratricopeptide (TPR) repeat protein
MNIARGNRFLGVLASAILGLVAISCTQSILADEFRLKDGRTLVGQLKSGPKADSPQWTVELKSGVLVRFPSNQLETNGHLKTEERNKLYKEVSQKVEPTAESHAALAGWCSKNGFKDQELAHYRRALDFNPDFGPARARLGYTKDSSGRWVERDELMTEGKGKVKIGGKYVYPEVYAFNDAKETLKKNTGKWNRQIDNLQKDIIANNANSERALAELLQINDPYAVSVIGAKLLAPKTPVKLQLIYIQMLTQFQSPDAVAALVQATLQDDEPQIRNKCLESLANYGRDYAIATYIGVLREFANKTLESSAPMVRLNRAAVGLNHLKADNAVLALIEALVTKYKMTRKQQDQINTSGAMSFGGKPETTIELAQNQDVYNALVNLTRGQNFLYDKQRWLNWYASVFAAPMGDLRRDP